MLVFDIRTLSFIAMISSLLLALGLQIINVVIKDDPSLRLWAIGETVFGTGMVLVWLRGLIPDFISIVLANTLLVIGVGFQYLGSQSFQGRKGMFPWYWCLAALTAVLFTVFTYISPNLPGRIVTYSAIVAVIRFAIALIILRPIDGKDMVIHRFVAVAYFITTAFLAVRGYVSLFIDSTDQDFMAMTSAIQTFTFVIEIGFNMVLAIGLPLLVFGRTHRLLIAGELRYRAMIELSPAPMGVLFGDTIRYVNPAAVRMFGASSALDLIGKPLLGLVHPDMRQFVLARLRATLARGDTNPKAEERLLKLDGTAIDVEVQSTPIVYDGKAAIQVIMTDVTERRINEDRIQSLLAEKENLLKEVHHRVKNNIAAIESLLSMQADDSANPEVKFKLQAATSQVQSMRILYEKLLLGTDYEEIPVDAYIESLVAAMADAYPESEKVDIELRIPEFALAANKIVTIGMALNEILTNAFKYAFKGRDSGHITIAMDRAADSVTLSVRDDGVGLPDGYDADEPHGFGTMILKALSASYSIESQNGTKSVLRFKI